MGCAANITETCTDENHVQLIADYILEKNIVVADTTMAKEQLPHLAEQHRLKHFYVDSSYSGESVYQTKCPHYTKNHLP